MAAGYGCFCGLVSLLIQDLTMSIKLNPAIGTNQLVLHAANRESNRPVPGTTGDSRVIMVN